MSQTAGETRSRLDPEPVARRDFLGTASLWSAVSALFLATVGMFRMPRPATPFSATKKFTVTLPESLPPGVPYVLADRQVAVFKDGDGVYAVSMICTHLGCVVKTIPDGFECPCHGSRFTADGSVTKGPAPEALPWLKVTVKGEKCIVDGESRIPAGTKVKS